MANPEHLDILRQGADAWNEWRDKNPFINPDLSGTNLRHEKLFGIILTATSLANSDLSSAMLAGSILIRTDLTNTSLRGANLVGATLRSAILNGANLTKANCGGTSLVDLDLSETYGLDTVMHTQPSYVDVHTLTKSMGNIPEVFLRGCGLPDEVISYIPSLFGKPIDYYSCFISYSHNDKSFARRLHDTLQGRGIRCWLDEHEINPGDDIEKEIDRGIRLWDKVILCASRNSIEYSWWVDRELNRLFEKERQLMQERGGKVVALIPVDLDGYLLSPECQYPKKTEILSRSVADFRGWEQDNAIFEREIERVIKALRTDGGKTSPPPSKL